MRYFITEETGYATKLLQLRKVADSKVDLFKANMAERKIKICKEVKPPSVKTMYTWMDDGVAKCPDGCRTEPDGGCPHGLQSWLIILGMI